MPWLLATAGGRSLLRRGNLVGLSEATGAAFASLRKGCVAGRFNRLQDNNITGPVGRIVCTSDSGHHWRVRWEDAPDLR